MTKGQSLYQLSVLLTVLAALVAIAMVFVSANLAGEKLRVNSSDPISYVFTLFAVACTIWQANALIRRKFKPNGPPVSGGRLTALSLAGGAMCAVSIYMISRLWTYTPASQRESLSIIMPFLQLYSGLAITASMTYMRWNWLNNPARLLSPHNED